MKRIVYIIFLTALASAPLYPGTVSFVIGSVKVKSGGEWKKADLGMAINDGDTVETGNRSMALISLDWLGQVKLYPDTKFTLKGGDKRDGTASLDLFRGALFTKIIKGPGRSFSIKYQTVVASVRGTLFYMAVHKRFLVRDDLWVCVNEGSIDVADMLKNESVLVKEGEGILVKGGKEITPPKAYEWTKKLNWNMDPSKGPVIDDSILKGDSSDSNW